MINLKVLKKIKPIKRIFLMCLTLSIIFSQIAPTLVECMIPNIVEVDLNFSNEEQWEQVIEDDKIYFESNYSLTTEEEIYTNELILNKGDILYFDLAMDNSTSNSRLEFLVNDSLYDTLSTTAVNDTYKYIALESGPYIFKWKHLSAIDLANDRLHIGNVYIHQEEGNSLPNGYKSGVFSPWKYEDGALYFSKENLSNAVSWLEKSAAISNGDVFSFEYFIDAANLDNCFTEFFIDGNKFIDMDSIGDWSTVSYTATEKNSFNFKWVCSCINDDTNDYKVCIKNLKVTKFYSTESKGHWYFSNPGANYKVNADVEVAIDPLDQEVDFSTNPIDYEYAYQNILPTISLWPAIDSFGSIQIYPINEINSVSNAEIRLRLTGNEFNDDDVKSIIQHVSLWQTFEGRSKRIVFSINSDGYITFKTDGFGIFTIAVDSKRRTDEDATDIEVEAKDSGDKVWFEAESPGIFLDSIEFSADTVLVDEKEEYSQTMDGLDEDIKKDTQSITVHEITATDGMGHKIKKFRNNFDLYIEKPDDWNNENGFILYINGDGEDEKFMTDEYVDPIDNKIYLHCRTNHLSPYAVVCPKASNNLLQSTGSLESIKTGDKSLSLIIYNTVLISSLISLLIIKKRRIKKI